MRVALEAVDVAVSNEELEAVEREVNERVVGMPAFSDARDLRLRLRHVKGALLCLVAVGFNAGGLVTSTATSSNPLAAVVGALDGLPERMERMPRIERRRATHADVRAEVKRLLG